MIEARRGRRTIRWSFFALILLVAVLATACRIEGRAFQTTLRSDSVDPLPVTLTDATGLVTGIAQAEVDPATTLNDVLPVLHTPPSDPSAAVLTWMGGLCDQDTTLWFHVLNGGYVLNVTTHGKLGLGCPAAGVYRAVRMTTSRPIPVDSIIVAGR